MQVSDLPLHAGPGPAPDPGDDRLSIVIADLLMWAIGAQVHQADAAGAAVGPLRDIPLIKAYSTYRLALLPIGIAIGVVLWLFLNRTRVGMMIRAGVDDRAMLSASGVNVNVLFAVTFAIGAGLAGFGGVIGAVELSMAPGEDMRLLLASLIVVIIGGMGSVVGAALGAVHPGLGRNVWPGLRADLQRGVYLRDPGAGAGLPAARHPREAGLSAANWRNAMNSGSGRAAMLNRGQVAIAVAWKSGSDPDFLPAVLGAHRGASRCRSGVSAGLSLVRDAVLHLPDRRAVADARADRAVAHLPRRLRRHGVARADDGGGDRRLLVSRSSARRARRTQPSAWAGRGGWR